MSFTITRHRPEVRNASQQFADRYPIGSKGTVEGRNVTVTGYAKLEGYPRLSHLVVSNGAEEKKINPTFFEMKKKGGKSRRRRQQRKRKTLRRK